mmetsp:Transcript_86055/g.277966  ORF Transcript_86055/g.277966 Transcript_86055/m.277966 type:complete len:329 (+) Transcript_86055:824-1810(+)
MRPSRKPPNRCMVWGLLTEHLAKAFMMTLMWCTSKDSGLVSIADLAKVLKSSGLHSDSRAYEFKIVAQFGPPISWCSCCKRAAQVSSRAPVAGPLCPSCPKAKTKEAISMVKSCSAREGSAKKPAMASIKPRWLYSSRAKQFATLHKAKSGYATMPRKTCAAMASIKAGSRWCNRQAAVAICATSAARKVVISALNFRASAAPVLASSTGGGRPSAASSARRRKSPNGPPRRLPPASPDSAAVEDTDGVGLGALGTLGTGGGGGGRRAASDRARARPPPGNEVRGAPLGQAKPAAGAAPTTRRRLPAADATARPAMRKVLKLAQAARS